MEEEFFLRAFSWGLPQGTVLSRFDLFVGLFDSAVVLVVARDTETKIQQTKPKIYYNMANAIFAMGCTSYKCYGDKKYDTISVYSSNLPDSLSGQNSNYSMKRVKM